MQFRVDTDGMTFIVGGIRGVMDFETKVPVLDKGSGVPLFDVDVMAVLTGERPEQLRCGWWVSRRGSRSARGFGSGICRRGRGRWAIGTGWRSRRAGWSRGWPAARRVRARRHNDVVGTVPGR